MDKRKLDTVEAPESGESMASKWPVLAALVIDIGGVGESHESQDAVTDFIWHMLERDYQIYICSSTTKQTDRDPLDTEDFAHRNLTWLTGEMPPSLAQVTQYPALTAPTTLWISDDARIRDWTLEAKLPFVSLADKTASFAPNLNIASWGELGNLLDPTTRAARQVADTIAQLRRTRSPAPIVVGLGGPPASGYERFAVELKRVLEASEFPLVELIDVTSFFPDGAISPSAALPLAKGSAAQWLVDTVLVPLGRGENVYIEKRPAMVPEEVNSVFPLFVSKETVVLLLGETALHRAFREHMHLAVVLEVTPAETARRMFEIPEGEEFDDTFVEQYLKGDGRAYAEYATANQVVERADLRVNANSPRRSELLPISSLSN